MRQMLQVFLPVIICWCHFITRLGWTWTKYVESNWSRSMFSPLPDSSHFTWLEYTRMTRSYSALYGFVRWDGAQEEHHWSLAVAAEPRLGVCSGHLGTSVDFLRPPILDDCRTNSKRCCGWDHPIGAAAQNSRQQSCLRWTEIYWNRVAMGSHPKCLFYHSFIIILPVWTEMFKGRWPHRPRLF